MTLPLIFLAIALCITRDSPRHRLRPGDEVGREQRIRAGPIKNLLKNTRTKPNLVELTADIELFATCLDAGLNSRAATEVISQVADPSHQEVWRAAVALLGLGVPAERAFAGMKDMEGLSELSTLAVISQRSGSAFSQGCLDICEKLRALGNDQRTATAERAGVLIAIPLVTCFLPAFIVVGLVPMVMSLGMNLLNNI